MSTITPLTDDQAERAQRRKAANCGEGFQQAANVALEVYGADEARELVREVATTALAGYPQYDGHHDSDDWKLMRARRRLRGKGGVRFEQGDVTIVRIRRDPIEGLDHLEASAYCLRHGWHCAFRPTDFEEVR